MLKVVVLAVQLVVSAVVVPAEVQVARLGPQAAELVVAVVEVQVARLGPQAAELARVELRAICLTPVMEFPPGINI
jgi:hypothetical protein